MKINDDDFALFDFEDDMGNTCYALVDTRLANFSDKNSYPYLLWVEIHYIDIDRNNKPTQEEADELDKAEELILKKLNKTCQFKFAGRTTLTGFRELIIYVDNADNATTAINRLKHDFNDRKVTFALENDPNWEGVEGFFVD